MRLLVCGGRTFFDVELLNHTLDEIHAARSVTLIIHGLATGADTLAGNWADRNSIPVEGYRAEWKKLGRCAGPIRNSRMLEFGKPDLVIIFPGKKGTLDMLRQTRVAKIPYKIIEKRGV